MIDCINVINADECRKTFVKCAIREVCEQKTRPTETIFVRFVPYKMFLSATDSSDMNYLPVSAVGNGDGSLGQRPECANPLFLSRKQTASRLRKFTGTRTMDIFFKLFNLSLQFDLCNSLTSKRDDVHLHLRAIQNLQVPHT